MGTRATYLFKETFKYNDEKTGKERNGSNKYGLIYTQYDGYPDGVPLDFVKYIQSGTMVNGLGSKQPEIVFNGMGCFMAQFIAKFKDKPGQMYMAPLNHRGESWEVYLYTFTYDQVKKTFIIIVQENYDGKTVLFKGTPEEYITKYENNA